MHGNSSPSRNGPRVKLSVRGLGFDIVIGLLLGGWLLIGGKSIRYLGKTTLVTEYIKLLSFHMCRIKYNGSDCYPECLATS